MVRCNLSLMTQFSCEELREKRERAESNIREDQRLKQSLEAQIRRIEIEIANNRAEIRRLRNQTPLPSLPGPVRRDNAGRPKPPKPHEIVLSAAQAAADYFPNRSEIRRLEGEIGALERRRQGLRPQYMTRLERWNEAQDSRGCIIRAMREKGCIGA